MKLGVIGCGRVTESRHLPALEQLRDAQVVAVADVVPDHLQRVANRFRIDHRCSDYRALLDDRQIEAVAVCVPPELHVEVALAALDAGKHLLIEKPLALSLDESDRLLERARCSSRKVMVGFNLRWHRLVRRARDMIHRGDLGPLELVRTVITSTGRFIENRPEWGKRRELGGGVLADQAVHHFDLWRFLLQSEVEEVFATSRCGQSDDEAATVTARMANGVLAASGFLQGTSHSNTMEVYGRAGRLTVSCYRFDGLEFLPASSSPGDVGTRIRGMVRAVEGLPQAAMRMQRGGDFAASYRAQWRHFLDSILHDTPVECTLEDGHRALQVVLAAMASASLRQPVRVTQGPRKITPVAPDIQAVPDGDQPEAT